MTGGVEDAERFSEVLGMQPVPVEGGRFAQSWRDDNSSGIYYLMTRDDVSGLHSLPTMELWSFHSGSPVSMLLLHPDGRTEEPVLGPDVTAGQRPQLVVPPGVQMAAEPTGDWSLVGTFMTPPYTDDSVRFGVGDDLVVSHPAAVTRIRRLARR